MSKPEQAELRREFWAMPEEALVDRETVAAVFYLSQSSLEVLAIKGGGPPYQRIGRRALYVKADVLLWAAKTGRRVNSTAQLSGAAA